VNNQTKIQKAVTIPAIIQTREKAPAIQTIMKNRVILNPEEYIILIIKTMITITPITIPNPAAENQIAVLIPVVGIQIAVPVQEMEITQMTAVTQALRMVQTAAILQKIKIKYLPTILYF
jgi:hypothetical protein